MIGKQVAQHKAQRLDHVDLARGMATVSMILGHASDAWVRPSLRDTWSFKIINASQTFPLAAFLTLAGLGLGLRIIIALQRIEDLRLLRRSLVLRGLQLVGMGYLVNLLYIAIDGSKGLNTVLRVDVLHTIGLSLAILSALVLTSRRASVRRLQIVALSVLVFASLICPLWTRLTHQVEGPLRYAIALFGEVPKVSPMPLIPLISWAGAGLWLAPWVYRTAANTGRHRFVWAVVLCASLGIVAFIFAVRTDLIVRFGIIFARTSPSIWLNIIDLGARSIALLACATLITFAVLSRHKTPGLFFKMWLRIGQHSLFMYVVHIPFCYGRLGHVLRRNLTPFQSLFAAVMLTLVSYVAAVSCAYLLRSLRKRQMPEARP